jgi:hypothetical protein
MKLLQPFPKRPRLAAALLLAAAVSPALADYSSTVLSQGPLGYWRMSETAQPPQFPLLTTNYGSLGTSENGTYNSGPAHGLPGPFAGSYAVNFSGSQWVTAPNSAAMNPAAFTIEAWLNPATNSPSGGFASPLCNGPASGSRKGWLIYQGTAAGLGTAAPGWQLRLYTNGPNASIQLLITNTVSPGTFYHVVFSFDGTTARGYLNGALVNSGTWASTPAFVPNTTVGLFVGARSDVNARWSGQASEVAYYSSALSDSQVAAHYAAASTNAAGYATQISGDGPIAYYRFLEPPIPVAANSGSLGAAVNGTYTWPAAPGVAGPRPSAYPGFDAGNYAVAFPGSTLGGQNNPSVSIPKLSLNTNTVTITCWVNLTNAQPFSAFGPTAIFQMPDFNGAVALTMDPIGYGDGHGFGYNWAGRGPGWSPYNDSGVPLAPDQDWAFVALLISPHQAAIFTAATNNYSSFAGGTNFVDHPVVPWGSAINIGYNNISGNIVNGAVDEVAVFNRTLSVGEVYDQYAAAVGGVPPRIFADPQAPGTIDAGDPLQLTVDAGGSDPLSYQWRTNGIAINGATSSTYAKTPADTIDSGDYDCVVSNPYGSVTSAVASVTVSAATAPSILTGPAGHTLYPGGTINLSVVAVGGGLTYQWSKGGANISGATGSSYSVTTAATAAAATNTGSYSVLITNSIGTATGGPVTITVLAPATAYETNIMNDQPEAWFRLNETSGTTMWDSMGRHDGLYTNYSGAPVTLGAPGALLGSSDTAVSFAGPGNYSVGFVPYSPALNNDTFSIECWAKTTDTVDTMTAVSSREGGLTGPHGDWLWTYPAGSWSGGIGNNGANYYIPSGTAADAVVAGQWKHVVMTYDPTLYQMKLYINGQWDGLSYPGFSPNRSAPFIIGGRGGISGVPGLDLLWNGSVDEVLVYTKVLNSSQVLNHYSSGHFGTATAPFFLLVPGSQEVVSNSGASFTLSGSADGSATIAYQWLKNGTAIAGATKTALALACDNTNGASYVLRATNSAGAIFSPAAIVNILPPNPPFANVTNSLVLHLKFDGDYQDSSGRGNNATPQGTPGPSLVPGVLGSGAMYFATTNASATYNYAALGTPADLNFGSSNDFSVSYWVKTLPGQTNGDVPFLCSALTSTYGRGVTIAPSYGQGGWAWSLNGLGIYGTAGSINNGNWHHVLHSFTRAGSGVTYLDGVQVDSRLIAAAGDVDAGNPWMIGQDPTGTYYRDGSATIDDLSVWRRALTAYEAYAIHYVGTNSGASFDVGGSVTLHLTRVGSNLQITWQPGATLGTLLQADSLSGPWTPVSVYVPSYTFTPGPGQKFFRLQARE